MKWHVVIDHNRYIVVLKVGDKPPVGYWISTDTWRYSNARKLLLTVAIQNLLRAAA